MTLQPIFYPPHLSPKQKLLFAHIDVYPRGEGTRVGRLTLASDGKHFGWSWCSPKDQFERARGRWLALRRMQHPRTRMALPHCTRKPWPWAWLAVTELVGEHDKAPGWADANELLATAIRAIDECKRAEESR